MDKQDNPVTLARNSFGSAMARRQIGHELRDAASHLYGAVDRLRKVGLLADAEQIENIADSVRNRFEIDEDGDALAYLDV
jgi:hypothetical protein